jgi:ribosomal-protein-alanine N-acetyltransferase
MVIEDLEKVSHLDRISFSLPWPESSFKFEIDQNEVSRCWVAETAGEAAPPVLAGMIVTWVIYDEVHIATFAVAPEFRNQKIAQRLLAHTLMDACHSGAQKVFLEVRRGNTAARALYQKFGFVEVGARPHYYQDNGEDAVMMNLEEIEMTRLECFL